MVTADNSRMPIPPRNKVLQRLYEPIVLEIALKKTRPQGPFDLQRVPNTISDGVASEEQAFMCFINRLAQVCDNRRGGSTVSAIAVLEEPDYVHYILGSNNRNHKEVQTVEIFATRLLRLVSDAQGSSQESIAATRREVLRHILRFNKDRVRSYLINAVSHLGNCIVDYERRYPDGTPASDMSFKRQLLMLNELMLFQHNTDFSEDSYFSSCERLFLWIHSAQYDNFGDNISKQSRDGEIDSSEPWMELRHFVGRLHSYHLAMETFMRASRRLRRLLHLVRVTVIASASIVPNFMKNKAPKANTIIGRMFPNDQTTEFRSQIERLPQSNLDSAIIEQCNDRFDAIVHAEILVLDYVLTYLKRHTETRFWKGLRYIGTSKPTCRPCNYYFAAHPSGVRVRQTHGNLYPRWRVPDVFDDDMAKQMEMVLSEITKRVRQDTRRLIESQQLQGGVHDSNSFSGLPSYLGSGRTDNTTVSDIATRMDSLAIDNQRAATMQSEIAEEGIQIIEGNATDSDHEEGGVVFTASHSRM